MSDTVTSSEPQIRQPAIAGTFYPSEASALRNAVQHDLNDAVNNLDMASIRSRSTPKVLVAPHAGLIYSGVVAARAYAHVLHEQEKIKRVVLLGPCHRVAVRGMALSSADAFRTPLGDVPLDRETCATLSKLSFVETFDQTHAQEHSLEIHLPFLQTILTNFQLVPIVVGTATPDQVAQALDLVWGGPETLIVISTDLSHFLDYDSCNKLDRQTTEAIEQLDINAIGDDQACGRYPLKGILKLAKANEMTIKTVDVRNSGDTAGTKDRVVGYGAWIIEEKQTKSLSPTKQILAQYGNDLLKVIGHTVQQGARTGKTIKVEVPANSPLTRDGACFVTIQKNGQLRGCIGSLQAHQPLIKDVVENSFKAAFRDPRFPPVSEEELDVLSIHLSILSAASPMVFNDEADFLDQLEPGVTGLIIEDNGHRATFLPSVWEQLPDKKEFLSRLKQKAGLTPDHWSNSFKAWSYTTEAVHADSLIELLQTTKPN